MLWSGVRNAQSTEGNQVKEGGLDSGSYGRGRLRAHFADRGEPRAPAPYQYDGNPLPLLPMNAGLVPSPAISRARGVRPAALRSLFRSSVVPIALFLAPAPLLVSCKPAAPTERSAAETATDQALAERVYAALSASPSFKYPDVKVTAYRGTVQLSGFVLSNDQKKSAEDAAKAVTGVNGVENKISLRP